MLKMPISYETYDGQTITEDFHFNLTQAETIMLDTEFPRGLVDWADKVSREKNVKEIARLFQILIQKAYGEKSIDGRGFIKTRLDDHGNEIPLARDFMQLPAYSNLYVSLVEDAEKAANFFNALVTVPKEKRAAVEKAKAEYMAKKQAESEPKDIIDV